MKQNGHSSSAFIASFNGMVYNFSFISILRVIFANFFCFYSTIMKGLIQAKPKSAGESVRIHKTVA
jgi:hypothetical protein